MARQEYSTSVFDIFWNPNISRAKQNYQYDQQALQSAMDTLASNYPKLGSIMKQEGLMNGDGSINADRFVNKNYVNALRERTSEGEQTAISAALQNAARNSSLNGQAGTNLGTAGIARLVNQNNIMQERNLSNQMGQEYNAARNLTMQYGRQSQQDAIEQAKANLAAQTNRANYDKEMGSSQSLGLLQNPQTYAAIVGALSGNPTAALDPALKAVTEALGVKPTDTAVTPTTTTPVTTPAAPSASPNTYKFPVSENNLQSIYNTFKGNNPTYSKSFGEWIKEYFPNMASYF